jgi:two-component system, NarL family, response regulator DesR
MHSQVAPATRLKLVLVDDHDGARDALVRRLSTDTRITVVGATASLDPALALARDHAPHVALVDTRRQDEQGVQVVSALAALPEAARPLVVVYTSFFDANDWRRLHLAGAREWLLKQIDVDVLYARLAEAVKRELPGSRWDGVR